ncbi:MAG TPA: DUF4390 domain-containing protein, partial [Polyangia bacterium]|nr:DUF4390 domain-containing protein [Polyangia bacterium]
MLYRACLALTTLALAATQALPARAQPPEERKTGLNRRDGRLLVSLELQDLFKAQDAQRLLSGFTSRVLVRVALFRLDSPEPVAQTMRHTEIVYDLWDEKFRVRRFEAGGKVETRETSTVGEAIDLAAALVAFPVASLDRLAPGVAYRVSLRADLNPISQELLADVRRWLARPSSRSRMGSGDSFFGSFVSIFVNPRIEESERQLRLLSQSWVEP